MLFSELFFDVRYEGRIVRFLGMEKKYRGEDKDQDKRHRYDFA